MRVCEQQASGVVELYFYDELDAAARASVEHHVSTCSECRQTLDDLSVISAALSSRPQVDAPQDGDWGAFMSRLDAEIRSDGRRESEDSAHREYSAVSVPHLRLADLAKPRVAELPNSRLWNYASYLATAALLTLVTSGLLYVGREASRSDSARTGVIAGGAGSVAGTDVAPVGTSGFAALSEQHFERSKLVVLGLANKDAKVVNEEDWAYERGLASNLLDDTRLYRMAAEDRGLTTLAGVMGDLELVLLQTSLADTPDGETLDRIQRLIQTRDLVTKMDVAATGS